MKIIQILSLAGLAVALTASASAFPFLVSSRNTTLAPVGTSPNSPTIAVSAHSQGVGQKSSKDITEPVAPTVTTPRYSAHRWR